MNRSSTSGFVGGAAVVSALGAGALAVGLRAVAPGSVPWGLAAWSAMALPGIAAGAWLAYAHGRPGGLFVAALGSGVVVRLALAGVTVGGAARSGAPAALAASLGLLAGFLPITVFEMAWFARRATFGRRAQEPRG